MATQIQLRRDTAAAWTAANPILASGEIGIETNTVVDAGGARIVKCKIGDGTLAWNSIPYTLLGVPLTIANVSGLQSELDGKAPVDHSHKIADVVLLPEALDAIALELSEKSAIVHSHVISDITDLEALLESIDNKTYSEIIRAGSTVPTGVSRWLVPGISSFGTSLVVNLVERAIHKDYRVISATSQPGTGSLTITREFTTPTGTVVHTDMLTIPAGSAIGEYVFNTTSFDARSIACNVKYTFFNNATSSSAFIQGLERTFCKIAA